MSIKNKKLMIKASTAFFALLLLVAAAVFVYGNSPLHPANISEDTILTKGADYKIRVNGISEYDESGFRLTATDFYFTSDKLFVCVDDEGFARTTDLQNSGDYVLGEFNSADMLYDDYTFCGQEYKTKEDLEAFFKSPDRIYDFDLDKLSYYVSDIISYEKKFYGTATLKIYKGRCVITSLSIGDERVLEYKTDVNC